MSKAEQIFESADFSGETDFKDRLRVRLFDEHQSSSLESVVQRSTPQSREKTAPGRVLSFEELEKVSAAGDGTAYRKRSPEEEQRKSNKML